MNTYKSDAMGSKIDAFSRWSTCTCLSGHCMCNTIITAVIVITSYLLVTVIIIIVLFYDKRNNILFLVSILDFLFTSLQLMLFSLVV